MIYGNIFLNTNKIFGGILLKIFANIDIVNSNLSNPNEKNLRHVRQFQNIKGLHRNFELSDFVNKNASRKLHFEKPSEFDIYHDVFLEK